VVRSKKKKKSVNGASSFNTDVSYKKYVDIFTFSGSLKWTKADAEQRITAPLGAA
jgi:hypothetical protein